eukprot:3440548-Pyramimonas_sp.AAC.1
MRRQTRWAERRGHSSRLRARAVVGRGQDGTHPTSRSWFFIMIQLGAVAVYAVYFYSGEGFSARSRASWAANCEGWASHSYPVLIRG